MKHLKLFQTEAEYTAYKDSEDFVLPNVSYVEETKGVSYEPIEDVKEDDIFYYANGTNGCDFRYNVTTKELDGFYYELTDPQNNEMVSDYNTAGGPFNTGNKNRLMVYPGEFEYEILGIYDDIVNGESLIPIKNGSGQYPSTDILTLEEFKLSEQGYSFRDISIYEFNGVVFRVHNLETNNNYDIIIRN